MLSSFTVQKEEKEGKKDIQLFSNISVIYLFWVVFVTHIIVFYFFFFSFWKYIVRGCYTKINKNKTISKSVLFQIYSKNRMRDQSPFTGDYNTVYNTALFKNVRIEDHHQKIINAWDLQIVILRGVFSS